MSKEGFDFIECFTTTFLRAHSWLNWVECKKKEEILLLISVYNVKESVLFEDTESET